MSSKRFSATVSITCDGAENGRWGLGERGITPVVATILLIGLTVAAVSVVAVFVGQMQPGGRAPEVEPGNIRAEVIQADSKNMVTRVSFTHRGGESLKARELRVTIHGIDNNGVERSTSIWTTSDVSIKLGDDVAYVLEGGQNFSTSRGEPYYKSGTEVEIFIIHEPTGMVLANVNIRVGGPFYPVYGDQGFGYWREGISAFYPWAGGGPSDAEYTGETPPEGTKCCKTDATVPAGWAGWGYYNPSDLSVYAGGYLKFWVKTPKDLKVEIKDTTDRTKNISQYSWDWTDTWQEIKIPINDFGADLSAITYPFMITTKAGEGNIIFCVDHVRWETGEAVPGPVNAPPVAGFSYSPSSPTTENIIQFIDQSTDSDGTIVAWSWNFGDGTPISNEQYPTHQYTTANTYTVTLTVTDDDGAIDSETKNITVSSGNNPPTASFTYSPSSPLVNEIIQFTDTSTDSDGTIVSWSWNFGDGTPISTLQNPTHQYSLANTYTVTLTVTDNGGATDSISNGITVTLEPVEVMFQNFEPANGTPGGTYWVDIWQSTTIFVSTAPYVHSGSRSIKTTTQAGGGTVRIMVADSDGYKDLSSATTFSFWIYDTQGNNTIQMKLMDGETVIFQAWSDWGYTTPTKSVQNTWTKMTWDISSVSNKSHITSIELYEGNLGVYYFDDVIYVVPGGVNEPPTASFSCSPGAPDVGETIQFTDTSGDSDGTIVSWSWNFGDGTPISTDRNPTHQYTTSNRYTVTLTVTDDDGATGSTSWSVHVGAFIVYNDSGIPVGTDVWIWPYPPTGDTWDGDYTGEIPPEGTKCFQTYVTDWAGWGVFFLDSRYDNLIGYNYLKFWVKSTDGIKDITVGMHSTMSSTGFSINEFGWDRIDNVDQWVEITIPRTRFSTISFYQVTCPFKATGFTWVGMSAAFYIDNVRWVK